MSVINTDLHMYVDTFMKVRGIKASPSIKRFKEIENEYPCSHSRARYQIIPIQR